jgi:hypothetical protein
MHGTDCIPMQGGSVKAFHITLVPPEDVKQD